MRITQINNNLTYTTMIVYKKTVIKKYPHIPYVGIQKEMIDKKTTIYFLGIPIYTMVNSVKRQA